LSDGRRDPGRAGGGSGKEWGLEGDDLAEFVCTTPSRHLPCPSACSRMTQRQLMVLEVEMCVYDVSDMWLWHVIETTLVSKSQYLPRKYTDASHLLQTLTLPTHHPSLP
jgi:hypothetical protein